MEESIRNIPQFIDLIERRKLKSVQICEILSKGFKIFADVDLTPEALIKELKQYWNDYGTSPDKPLFLDSDINIDEYLEEHQIETRLWTEYKTTNAAIIASLHKNKGSIVGSKENNTYYLLGEPCLQFGLTIPHPDKNTPE